MFGLLDREPTITSAEAPHLPEHVDGDVAFENVTVTCGDREPVLHDVSGGTTVGVVGATGAGRSTLLRLVPGFHDVDEGRVTVDGTDVRGCDPQALRNSIAVVEQDPYLFSGTVAENVARGDRGLLEAGWEGADDESARERVRAAAEAAAADGFTIDRWRGQTGTETGPRPADD